MSKNKQDELKTAAQAPVPAEPDVSRATDADIQKAHDALLSRKEAPPIGFSPAPIFFIFLTSAIILTVAIYMVWSSDDFDVLGYDDTRRRFAWEAETVERPPPDPRAAGRRVFTTTCQACHQADGMGMPPAFPPLAGTRTVIERDERLILVVLYGLMGPVEIQGVTYNSAMPGLGTTLSDEDVANVLTYIRQSWGNEADPISVEQVREVRERVGPRTQMWTDAELEDVAP